MVLLDRTHLRGTGKNEPFINLIESALEMWLIS